MVGHAQDQRLPRVGTAEADPVEDAAVTVDLSTVGPGGLVMCTLPCTGSRRSLRSAPVLHDVKNLTFWTDGASSHGSNLQPVRSDSRRTKTSQARAPGGITWETAPRLRKEKGHVPADDPGGIGTRYAVRRSSRARTGSGSSRRTSGAPGRCPTSPPPTSRRPAGRHRPSSAPTTSG